MENFTHKKTFFIFIPLHHSRREFYDVTTGEFTDGSGYRFNHETRMVEVPNRIVDRDETLLTKKENSKLWRYKYSLASDQHMSLSAASKTVNE